MFRYLIAGITLLAGLALASGSFAEEKKGDLTLLFVQTAQDAALDGDQLTLKGLGKSTLFFSDRPERVAGHMQSKDFVASWGEGKDSFASDPPNATLSILSGDAVQNLVVELRQPKLRGNDLTYTVKLIEGKMPKQVGACSLFIDIIGRPFTPLSYAGVARRTTRRAIVYGAPAMVVAAQPAPVVVQQSPASSSGTSTEQKMQELQDMYDKGLITQGQYDQKRQALLNDM